MIDSALMKYFYGDFTTEEGHTEGKEVCSHGIRIKISYDALLFSPIYSTIFLMDDSVQLTSVPYTFQNF